MENQLPVKDGEGDRPVSGRRRWVIWATVAVVAAGIAVYLGLYQLVQYVDVRSEFLSDVVNTVVYVPLEILNISVKMYPKQKFVYNDPLYTGPGSMYLGCGTVVEDFVRGKDWLVRVRLYTGQVVDAALRYGGYEAYAYFYSPRFLLFPPRLQTMISTDLGAIDLSGGERVCLSWIVDQAPEDYLVKTGLAKSFAGQTEGVNAYAIIVYK